MKTKYSNIKSILILAISISFVLSSCEDKIDVALDPAEPIVVVDAFLTDIPGQVQEITITKTQPYFDNSAPEPVQNATVDIAIDDILINFEYEDGRYTWHPDNTNSIADFGSSYDLIITIDEVQYTAKASLNRSPEIEEIRQEIRQDEIGSVDGGIYCEFIARDFDGLGDTYWIKSFKNGVFLNKAFEINLAYDAGFDAGAESDGLIFIPPIRELINPIPDDEESENDVSPWAVGDTCRVEIHSISNEVFAFMETMRDQLLNGSNGIFSEPLANTPSNIISSDNSVVLGAFNVAKVTSRDYIIQ